LLTSAKFHFLAAAMIFIKIKMKNLIFQDKSDMLFDSLDILAFLPRRSLGEDGS